MLSHVPMTRKRIGRLGSVALLILGVSGLPATAAAEVTTLSVKCPGYVNHLRTARAYLARGERMAAAAELRQAKSALDACARGDATSDPLARNSAAPATS